MFEDVKSESIESNQKNDELNQELQQYWKKIITNLGENFLHLQKFSKECDSLEIIQSLNLLEQAKRDQICKYDQNEISSQFELLKSQSINNNQEMQQHLDGMLQMIEKQQQIEQKNNEMLIKLMKTQVDNSKKLTDLQIDLQRENTNKYSSNILNLRGSMIDKAKSTIPYSAYNSPDNREIRQQSMYNNLLSNIKLTHVSGTHNDNNTHLRKVSKINPLF
ncbi:unnamed protein product [Paramecium pentaurelia]|uniref:Uncharacterized protein n=1 Tax=Paramecium pentaurelia TaxID=43138 RepID=A0A8S1S0P2_9CILI|nr:unnamed protein product [Paramecium pentaurelia]